MPYDLPADGQLAGKIAAVHARRCAGCHEAAEVSRLDWIDLARPEQSRFLAAPLAKTASGTGKCREAVYQDPTDPTTATCANWWNRPSGRHGDLPRRDLKSLEPKPKFASR